MKRLLFRLSALAGVVVLGWIAIAQAQRVMKPADPAAPATLPVAARDLAPRPIPLIAAAEPQATAPNDPFGRRSEPSPETNPAVRALPGMAQVSHTVGAIDNRYGVSEEPTPARVNVAENRPNEVEEPGRFRVRGDETPMAPNELPNTPTPADRYLRSPAQAAAIDMPVAADNAAPTPAEFNSRPGYQLAAGTSGNENSVATDNFAPAGPGAQPAAAELPAGDLVPVPANRLREPGDAFARPNDSGVASDEGSGRPGSQQLEGPQAPHLTIEKTAPTEIQVGKPVTFSIKVRNTGSVAAHGVEVHDEIPRGTQLVSTTPKATRSPQGALVWELGVIKPGDEAIAQLQLLPLAEGEIGSTATVTFKAEASVRTVATKPELSVKLFAPPQVMIGENLTLKIKVTNSGSGIANGVVLSENVPPGLKHAAGNELEFEVGSLKPGESRELDLTLTAAIAGTVTNTILARGDANIRVEEQIQIQVIAPALKVAMTGPKKRYLERAATFNISVSNPGTAPAKDIELVTVLPKGLKFVEANNAGQYDAATHSVYWSLEELPMQESGSVTLTTLPIEPGELKLQIKGQAKQGLSDQQDEIVTVEGLSAIQFELVDLNDPVEVNGETTYEIRVVNQGSKAATNVRLVALLPPEMKALSAEGPARHVVDGQRVLFDPLPRLAPKADTTYSVRVKGLQPGDLRIRVQVVTDEIRTPITREESTRVYADE